MNNGVKFIWCDYNNRASTYVYKSLQIPENMKLEKICSESGLIANENCPVVMNFYFDLNSALPEVCYIHSNEKIDEF